MTNRQFNVLIVCIGVSWIALMWLGYKLRQWVERWQDRRARVRDRERRFAEKYGRVGVAAEAIAAGTRLASEQDARQMLKEQKVIPLVPKARRMARTDSDAFKAIPIGDPTNLAIPPGWLPSIDHKDVIAALVSSGFKHAKAVTAVHACTPEERVDLETWVANAIRRAVSK